MKTAFAGGKNIGYECLEYLINSRKSISCVIVNPNDDSNTWYRSARELAKKNNILISEDIDIVREIKPDLLVVVYYDKILKKDIISVPKYGCINLHMALAEEYRGCYPTTWAIINGEKHTGVTLHYIDEGVDSGDIIAQSIVDILDTDTGKSLYDKCTKAGIRLFKETFPLIESRNNKRRKQNTSNQTKYYKREFPSHEVQFKGSGEDVYNYIRAMIFPPFPKSYFYVGDKRYTIELDKSNTLSS